MKLFAVAAGLLFACAAQASPFLVGDVDPIADTCTVTGLPAAITPTVPEVGGMCKWDLANLPVGNYTVTATAENVWAKSVPSAPFSFARSATTTAPGGLRLVP